MDTPIRLAAGQDRNSPAPQTRISTAGAETVYYLYELHRARQAHQVHGGVLLDFGEMYLVCSFDDAIELRSDDLDKSIDQAHYWAMMGESGYDETDPLVRRLKACLLEGTHEVLAEAKFEPGTYLA